MATSHGRRPSDQQIRREVKALTTAAQKALASINRFSVWKLLGRIYRLHRSWRRKRVARRAANGIARLFGIRRRQGTHPLKVLVDAAAPQVDAKQRSRWARALEQALEDEVPAGQLRKYLKENGGIAGAARQAARQSPKRITHRRNDWA